MESVVTRVGYGVNDPQNWVNDAGEHNIQCIQLLQSTHIFSQMLLKCSEQNGGLFKSLEQTHILYFPSLIHNNDIGVCTMSCIIGIEKQPGKEGFWETISM